MMKYTVIFKPRCIRKLWPGTTFQQQTLFTFEGQGLQLLVLVFTLFSEHFVVFHGSTSDCKVQFLLTIFLNLLKSYSCMLELKIFWLIFLV